MDPFNRGNNKNKTKRYVRNETRSNPDYSHYETDALEHVPACSSLPTPMRK